jgi:hypothetical protein
MELSLLPKYPYRGLKSFRYPDQNIFSGREVEVDKIYRLLLQFRGMMVFGSSGTGKSSLIGAGLIPLLLSKSFLPEVIRLNPDDTGTFVVTRILKDEEKNGYFNSYFDEFIDAANPLNDKINISFDDFKNKIAGLESKITDQPDPVVIRSQQRKKISVLIFDQFEELITHFEESLLTDNLKIHSLTLDERVALQVKIIGLLTECYYKENLFVKLIMVFREDYLAKFGKLFNSIPDLKDHYLRIKPMSVLKLREIVRRPFDNDEKRKRFTDPFSNDLIELVTQKLNSHFQDGNLILTEVQIVCLQLYNLHSDSQRITALNEQPVSKILENFYLDLLNKLNSSEKPLAIDILSLLVLNEKTRNIYHEDAIIEELEKTYKVPDIKRVIKKLEEDINIIRREIRQGGTYYEIVSEAIIPDINRRRIEKSKEKELSAQKKRQQFWAIAALSMVTIFIAGFFYFKSNKLQHLEKIKVAEGSWYQKLPDDSIRNEALATLYRFGSTSTGYKKYKTLFAILAQSYYYSSVNNYNDALAIAYYAYKGFESTGDDPIKHKFTERINDFMMPFQTLPIDMKSVVAVFYGIGSRYLLLSSDKLITARDANDAGFKNVIAVFANASGVADVPGSQTYDNSLRHRMQALPSIEILETGTQDNIYLVYNNNSCYLFDKNLKQLAQVPVSKADVMGVFPVRTGNFMVLYGNGIYELFSYTNNGLEAGPKALPVLSGNNPDNITSLSFFDNRKYFTITYITTDGEQTMQCEIQNDGTIISKPVADDESVIDINTGQMRLVSIDNRNFKIRNERFISSFIPGSVSAKLLGDTNLVVSYRYNKAAIYQIQVTDSGLMLTTKQVINQLPENKVPVVYSRGGHVIIKSNRSFILYDLKTGRKRYLFSAASNHNENGFDKTGRSSDLFINDSIFAVINDQAVSYYNVSNDNKSLQVSKEQDGSLRNMAFNLLKNNDEMDQQELFNLFPQELGKGLLEAFFLMGNYDSSVALAQKMLPLAKRENKLYLYQKLYDCYENLRNTLPSTSRNIKTQLYDTRQMVRYADSLSLMGADTTIVYNEHIKAMGALSWYLILSGEYKNALDTASIAIALDNMKQQQWIHTNLALGYLFNDSLPAALNVYNEWRDKYFNDDFKKAGVRFQEDIENLKSNYGIELPHRTEVLRVLK